MHSISALKRIAIQTTLVLALIWICTSRSAQAEVKDETNLFSSQAIQQADQFTRDIRQKHGKEVLLEVFPEIPSNLRANYSEERKDQFFDQWLSRRAQELKVDGIYVLITRNPSYVKVGAGVETRKRAFTDENITEFKNILVNRFRNNQYDQGLLEGVQYVQRTLEKNLAATAGGAATPQYHSNRPGAAGTNAPAKRGMGPLGWILVIGLGIFILMMIMRARRNAAAYAHGGNYPPGSYPPGQYPGGYPQGQYPGGYPPQSGGFGRGMMGGLLGGMAGGWLYDKFRGSGGGSNYGPPPDAGGQSLGDDQGQGFTGSGGDFGGGGGDFGGGDAGGGDFGGGGDSGGDF